MPAETEMAYIDAIVDAILSEDLKPSGISIRTLAYGAVVTPDNDGWELVVHYATRKGGRTTWVVSMAVLGYGVQIRSGHHLTSERAEEKMKAAARKLLVSGGVE